MKFNKHLLNLPLPFHFSLFIFFLVSCGSDTTSIPKEVIQPDEMVPLLVDMHKADAEKQVNRLYYPDSTRKDTVNYALIFTKHNTSRVIYDSSMSFYTKHPELLDEVYNRVMESLNQEKIEKEISK